MSKKTEHYVPRVYLKQFSYGKNNDFYINAYDISEKKGFTPNIKNICCERNFYDIESNNILDKRCLEDTFSKIEGKYRILFKNVVENFSWFSILINKFFTYQLLAIQMLRLPNSKKLFKQSYLDYCNKELDYSDINILVLRELLNTIECKDSNKTPFFLEYLLKNFGEVSVCMVSKDKEAISSDNPIIQIRNFKCYGNVIIYPVSFNRYLLFFKKKLKPSSQVKKEAIEKCLNELDDNKRSDLLNNFNKENFIRLLDRIAIDEKKIIKEDNSRYPNIIELSKDDVNKINSIVFAQAKKVVVSKNKISDFDLKFYNKVRINSRHQN